MSDRAYRPRAASDTPITVLVLTVAAAMMIVSGLWLWFFSEPTALEGAAGTNDLAEPFTLHLWVRRLHVVMTVVVAVASLVLMVRAFVTHHPGRVLTLCAAGGLLVVGFWSAFAVNWHEVELWRATMQTKMDAFSPFGDAPSLGGQLSRFRTHAILVPTLLAALAIGAYVRARRPTSPR